jgi:hypothetical protein
MLATMTAELETPQPAGSEESAYHVRTSISQDAKRELFRLRSRWEAIIGDRVALPTVSKRILEMVLDSPILLQQLIDEVRAEHDKA